MKNTSYAGHTNHFQEHCVRKLHHSRDNPWHTPHHSDSNPLRDHDIRRWVIATTAKYYNHVYKYHKQHESHCPGEFHLAAWSHLSICVTACRMHQKPDFLKSCRRLFSSSSRARPLFYTCSFSPTLYNSSGQIRCCWCNSRDGRRKDCEKQSIM